MSRLHMLIMNLDSQQYNVGLHEHARHTCCFDCWLDLVTYVVEGSKRHPHMCGDGTKDFLSPLLELSILLLSLTLPLRMRRRVLS
jgi:hypothetical protein